MELILKMDPIKDFINCNQDMFISFSDGNLAELHRVLLEITNDVIDFCEANNLCYFLGGGTALGAVRHKGFIPWDEDVDLVMPRKDYNQFAISFSEKYSDKYIVEVPNSSCVGSFGYMKIRKKGTVLQELISDESSVEIFVDIFPLEYAPESRIRQRIEGWYLSLFRDIAYTILYAKQYNRVIKDRIGNCPFKTRFELKAGYILGSMLSIIPLKKWVNWLDSCSRHSEGSHVVIPTGLHNYRHELFSSDYYFPPKKGEFEGRKVNLPNRIEDILTEFYGDYMVPPPESGRARHFFLQAKF